MAPAIPIQAPPQLLGPKYLLVVPRDQWSYRDRARQQRSMSVDEMRKDTSVMRTQILSIRGRLQGQL